MLLVTTGSALASSIDPATPVASIWPPPIFAPMMACRNEPGPASSRFRTLNVAPLMRIPDCVPDAKTSEIAVNDWLPPELNVAWKVCAPKSEGLNANVEGRIADESLLLKSTAPVKFVTRLLNGSWIVTVNAPGVPVGCGDGKPATDNCAGEAATTVKFDCVATISPDVMVSDWVPAVRNSILNSCAPLS